MRYLFIALLLLGICGSLYSQDVREKDGKRPFKETEKIDTDLLQSLVNRKLGELIRQAGASVPYDERIAEAANIKMRNPDIKDQTDEYGFHVPATKIILRKNGYDCRYVDDALYVEAKTICPTIRNFDASDTYENVAARFVSQMFDSNRQNVTGSSYKAYGAGVYAYEDWERNRKGQTLLNEPKCTRIRVLFVFVF